jgi:hypothetical protein
MPPRFVEKYVERCWIGDARPIGRPLDHQLEARGVMSVEWASPSVIVCKLHITYGTEPRRRLTVVETLALNT